MTKPDFHRRAFMLLLISASLRLCGEKAFAQAQQPIRIAADKEMRLASPPDINTGTIPQFVRGDDVEIDIGLFASNNLITNGGGLLAYTNVIVAVYQSQTSTNAPLMLQTNYQSNFVTSLTAAGWLTNSWPTNYHVSFYWTGASGQTCLNLNGNNSQYFWLRTFCTTTDAVPRVVTFLEEPLQVWDGPNCGATVAPAITGGQQYLVVSNLLQLTPADTNFFVANSNLLNAAVAAGNNFNGTAITNQMGVYSTNSTNFAQSIGTGVSNNFQWGAAVLSNLSSLFPFGATGIVTNAAIAGLVLSNSSTGNYTFMDTNGNTTNSGLIVALGGIQSPGTGGALSFVLGPQAIASSSESAAIGYQAQATAFGSLALGLQAHATSSDSVAIGPISIASNTFSMAVGDGAISGGAYSLAQGFVAEAFGAGSIAVGYDAITGNFISGGGTSNVAVGAFALGLSPFSVELGYKAACTNGNNSNSIAIGAFATAVAFSDALGMQSYASNNSIALGFQANTSGFSNAIAIGNFVTNTASDQVLFGPGVTLTGLSALTNAGGNVFVDATVTNALSALMTNQLTNILTQLNAGTNTFNGTALSNLVGVLSTNGTNFAASQGALAAATATAAMQAYAGILATNATNFTGTISTNATNFALTQATSAITVSEAFSGVLSTNATNYAASLIAGSFSGTALTNLILTNGINSTNFAAMLSTNDTNFASTVVGLAATNYAKSLGTTISNYAQAGNGTLSNIVAHETHDSSGNATMNALFTSSASAISLIGNGGMTVSGPFQLNGATFFADGATISGAPVTLTNINLVVSNSGGSFIDSSNYAVWTGTNGKRATLDQFADLTLSGNVTANIGTFQTGISIPSGVGISLISAPFVFSSSVTMSGGAALSGTVTVPLSTLIAARAASSTTIDWSQAFSQSNYLASSSTYNMVNTADGESFTVSVTAAGAFGVTWSVPVGQTLKWSGGSAPAQTANKTDVYTFIRIGTTIYGSAVQNF